MKQLALLEVEPVIVPASHPLTAAQREIIAQIREHGHVRSVEAGRIVHLRRPCFFCNNGHKCPWASTDGNEAMKRLMKRGFVVRSRPGRWNLA